MVQHAWRDKRAADFKGPGDLKLDPKSTKICSKSSQDRIRSPLGTDFESFLSNKSAQERPKGVQERPKSVSGAPKSAPRATQERFGRLYVVASGCMWLHLVAVQRRWEADGEGGER